MVCDSARTCFPRRGASLDAHLGSGASLAGGFPSAPRRRYDENWETGNEKKEWWGFKEEEECNEYVDSFEVMGLMVILACIGAIPKLITGVGLTWTLARSKGAPPVQVEEASAQMVPMNVQMAPAQAV
jgi:hypothetical protein